MVYKIMIKFGVDVISNLIDFNVNKYNMNVNFENVYSPK